MSDVLTKLTADTVKIETTLIQEVKIKTLIEQKTQLAQRKTQMETQISRTQSQLTIITENIARIDKLISDAKALGVVEDAPSTGLPY